MRVGFLLVTCCLEPSRSEILGKVISNLQKNAPELMHNLTVFDNASSEPGTIELLGKSYDHVYRSDRNVGYWSAIDWWLGHLSADPPSYTYIIESDMIHYAFDRLWECRDYLDANADVGSVRVHEYSVAERHLYNKDRPRQDSRRNLWQSHTNKVTTAPVKLDHSSGNVWSTTFLTQLPALNRFVTMQEVFAELRAMPAGFTELDFQRLYWQRYQRTGIVDGGIFHCDLNPYGAKAVTGSWTSPADLKRLGYLATRMASITPRDQYTVTRVG